MRAAIISSICTAKFGISTCGLAAGVGCPKLGVSIRISRGIIANQKSLLLRQSGGVSRPNTVGVRAYLKPLVITKIISQKVKGPHQVTGISSSTRLQQ
jgi:hypothetical protein